MTWADPPRTHAGAPRYGVPIVWQGPGGAYPDGGQRPPWRTCSYCGSIHPADLLALDERVFFKSSEEFLATRPSLEQMQADMSIPRLELADMKYGWPHKVYLHGVDSFGKFYVEHGEDAEDDATLATLSALLDRTTRVSLHRGERGLMWRIRPRG